MQNTHVVALLAQVFDIRGADHGLKVRVDDIHQPLFVGEHQLFAAVVLVTRSSSLR